MNRVKLVFLGTGVATNVERFKTSVYVRLDPMNHMLLDVGGGTEILTQLAENKIDPIRINHIFVSHTHFDHCLGLPSFLFYLFVDRAKEAPRVLTIYSSTRIVKDLKRILTITGAGITEIVGDRLRWVQIRTETPIRITHDCELIAFPAKHRINLGEDSLSCVLQFHDAGKRIVYTGDSQPNKYLDRHAKNADIVIHDCLTTSENTKAAHAAGHSTARDAAELATRANAKQLVLSHLQRERLMPTRRLKAEARNYYQGEILLARDSMRILL